MGHRFIIIAIFALIPSLAAGSPGAPSAAKAPTPFQLVKGGGLFEQTGCLIISADGAEVGCLEHDLDMGDIGTTLRIFGASGPYKAKVEFHLYSGSSDFETAGLDEKAMDKANAYLAKKAFTATGKSSPTDRKSWEVKVLGAAAIVSLHNKKQGYFDVRGMLPLMKTKKRRLCCGWVAMETVWFSAAKKVVVTFQPDCAYERLHVPKNDTCYDDSYCGGECKSWTPTHILLLDTP